MQNIFKQIFILFAIFCSFSIYAQYSNETYKAAKSKFSNEKVVELNKEIVYEITENKGKLEIIIKSNESYIYLKNVSVIDVKRSVYSSEMNKLVSYEANIYSLINGSYKKSNIKEKKEISNSLRYSFYDDLQEYSIDFGNINEGTIVELNTIHKITDPHLIRSIFINEYLPVNKFALKFIVDKNVVVRFIPINLKDSELTYQSYESKSSIIYEWNGENIEAIDDEDFTPDEKYYIPHIIPVIEKYTVGNSEINVLSTVQDLYNWYYTFIENSVNEEISPELKKLSDSLTIGCNTNFEKVQNIYYWVQSNIKYIAFEYGMGGFIPRKPAEILHNRYGDCKDKSCILYTLINAAGIKSFFTWIGTNDIPYTYGNVPAPITDNHMIITYIDNDTYYFLDGTSSNLPIGVPSSFIQGKEALIAISSENYEIKTVPVVTAESNNVIDSITIQIKDQQIVGSGDITVNGYPFYFFNERYSSRDNSDKKETVKNYLGKGNNKFLLTDYKITSLKDFDKSGKMAYNFTVGDYVKTIDHEIYLNLNMERSLTDFRIDTKRKYPMLFEFNTHYRFKAILDIPMGYEVVFIPDNQKFEAPEFGYDISYELSNNQLIYEHTHYRNILLIENEQIKAWNNYINKLENDYKETILLKQIQK